MISIIVPIIPKRGVCLYLTGQRFGRLTVLSHAKVTTDNSGSRHYWNYRCDCGKTGTRRGDQFKESVSCGCFSVEHARTLGYRNRGRIRTPENRAKISRAKLANPTRYWLGKKRSTETLRKISLTKRLKGSVAGERNPAWNGGVSREGYPHVFNLQLKEQIRLRDGYCCARCGRTQAEEKAELNRALCVNHIDFDKLNCDPMNLNTLCLRCNASVNANRPYWTKVFQEQMSSRAA